MDPAMLGETLAEYFVYLFIIVIGWEIGKSYRDKRSQSAKQHESEWDRLVREGKAQRVKKWYGHRYIRIGEK